MDDWRRPWQLVGGEEWPSVVGGRWLCQWCWVVIGRLWRCGERWLDDNGGLELGESVFWDGGGFSALTNCEDLAIYSYDLCRTMPEIIIWLLVENTVSKGNVLVLWGLLGQECSIDPC